MIKIRDVRRRIQSVKNTQQVTRAMKMVSVAKVRRFQAAAIEARPYASHLEEIITALLQSDKLPGHPLLQKRKSDINYLVVIAGDRGLCGSYNASIFKAAEVVIKQNTGQLKLIVLGRKGVDYFRRKNISIEESFVDLEELDREILSKKLAAFAIDKFVSGKCRQIEIVFSEFISIINQQTVTKQVLPFNLSERDTPQISFNTIYHPSPEVVIDQILPRYLLTIFNHAILESMASVHGARMITMDTATRNADKLIEDLILEYNQARQSTITRELIEIVAGAEALNS
ncbi:ATP synthase F1 subunit gamma [bacterium]|nr:ATP synthase F1 subunit gamma [bacterium]